MGIRWAYKGTYPPDDILHWGTPTLDLDHQIIQNLHDEEILVCTGKCTADGTSSCTNWDDVDHVLSKQCDEDGF